MGGALSLRLAQDYLPWENGIVGTDWREKVINALSAARMLPYLERSANNQKQALQLYQWHGELTASVQTVLGNTEVILRNAIDAQLQTWTTANLPGARSWLLDQPAAPLRSLSAAKRKDALRRANKQATERPTDHRRHNQPVSHDDVLAQIMFGMWRDLLPNHLPNANPDTRENRNRTRLWDETLREAFPYVHDPDGSVTFWRVAHLHRLRNRVSHVEPLLDIDVRAHIQEAFDLVASINPAVAQWLTGTSQVSAVLKRKPTTIAI